MASRYNRFKYNYTNDRNQNQIKLMNAYYVEEGSEKRYTTPLTPLFMARVVTNDAKVNGTSNATRRLITFVNEANQTIQRTAHLPYSPLDPILPLHIREILAVSTVICGNYEGESPLGKFTL